MKTALFLQSSSCKKTREFFRVFFCDAGKSASQDADLTCERNIFGSLSMYIGLFSYEKSPVFEELVKREDARSDDQLCKNRAPYV